MTTKKIATIALGLAATLGLASSASATVFIQIQTAGFNSGNPMQVASGLDTASFSGTAGAFTISALTGTTGVSPVLLLSDSINKVKKGKGVLKIWITETNVNAPVGNLSWTSGFTENILTKGWSVLEQTDVDPANGKFVGNLLASQNFTAIGSTTFNSLSNSGPGPYSVTEFYRITATGPGQNQATITLSAIPEPASWALMLVGFGGLGYALRSRRKLAKARI